MGRIRIINMEMGEVCEGTEVKTLKRIVRNWIVNGLEPTAIIIEIPGTGHRLQWAYRINGKKVIAGRNMIEV